MGRITVSNEEVYSFTAGANITSGIIVSMSGAHKVGTCHYSGKPVGVALIPASYGKAISVVIAGIVEIKSTGTVSYGSYVAVSNGVAFSGTKKYARDYVGIALESITSGSTGRILLDL